MNTILQYPFLQLPGLLWESVTDSLQYLSVYRKFQMEYLKE